MKYVDKYNIVNTNISNTYKIITLIIINVQIDMSKCPNVFLRFILNLM